MTILLVGAEGGDVLRSVNIPDKLYLPRGGPVVGETVNVKAVLCAIVLYLLKLNSVSRKGCRQQI